MLWYHGIQNQVTIAYLLTPDPVAGLLVAPFSIQAAAAVVASKFMGVPRAKPMMDFHQIFSLYLPQQDLELDYVLPWQCFQCRPAGWGSCLQPLAIFEAI